MPIVTRHPKHILEGLLIELREKVKQNQHCCDIGICGNITYSEIYQNCSPLIKNRIHSELKSVMSKWPNAWHCTSSRWFPVEGQYSLFDRYGDKWGLSNPYASRRRDLLDFMIDHIRY